MTDSIDARTDWENRIAYRSDSFDTNVALPPPGTLVATSGAGYVFLRWDRVEGAAGYLIEMTGPDGERSILHHGGSDVPAVPDNSFAVTGLSDGVGYSFRVAAIADPRANPEGWSPAAAAATSGVAAEPVSLFVAAGTEVGRTQRLWNMVGSERLSQLLIGEDGNGHDIGAEFYESLKRAHDDLDARWVRAHAIFHDDLEVVTRSNGVLTFNFSKIHTVYDMVLEAGLRPVVELSFMPRALASDPEKTVFTYKAIVSPPSDWEEWYLLVRSFAADLVERYGLAEVATWPFEVWNEPNLDVFWSGSKEDYLRLYGETARALKAVDASLKVGGPSSAASEWVEALASYAEETGVPLDFATTHTYGNLPLDMRPALDRHGFAGIPIYWTEWGVGSTHFGPVNDAVTGAPFILTGYESSGGRIDALAYWVVSDHFEELGRPPRLFHNGFGLLSVGNLRKPRYWAVHLAARQGDRVLKTSLSGDSHTVHANATSHDDGTLDLLLWNGTINTDVMGGDPRLNRVVSVNISGLAAKRYTAEVTRIDASHSNIVRYLDHAVLWPTKEEWEVLRAHDHLDTEVLPDLQPVDGTAAVEVFLPQPGVARLRLKQV